jgi:hypothetical protein
VAGREDGPKFYGVITGVPEIPPNSGESSFSGAGTFDMAALDMVAYYDGD